MRLSKFKEKYRISDTPALDAIARVVDARNLSDALDTTINNSFRGAADFEYEIFTDGRLEICIDFLALTIRKTLTSIFGEEFVKIKMTARNDTVKISFDVGNLSLITREACNDITKTARAARFEIEYTENGFVLTAKMLRGLSHTLYAVSINDIAARLRLIIFK